MPDEPQSGHKRVQLRRGLITLAGPLVLIGIVVYLVIRHGGEVGQAANRVSFSTLLIATLLAVVALIARSEQAVACLSAMGDRPSRLDIHPASSAAFVVGTVNHYIASPVRAAVLKRLDRGRAPTIPQMIMVDASTYLIEGVLAAALLVASAGALKLHWWLPVLAVIGAIGALAAALLMRRRLERYTAFRGLEMLAHSRQRLVVVAWSAIIFISQIVRTLLVLKAVGLQPTLLQATATFVAAGLLSGLLTGPGAGTAGAPLIIFGHDSLSEAAAAGLILSITALSGAILYALACSPVAGWRLKQRPRASQSSGI